MTSFGQGGHPKALIETLSESLLAEFKAAPLADAYDVYQHLMDYCAETLQDDAHLIAAIGWQEGAKPREIRQVKNKDGKLVWPSIQMPILRRMLEAFEFCIPTKATTVPDGWRVWSQSTAIGPISPAGQSTGSRSRTASIPRWSG